MTITDAVATVVKWATKRPRWMSAALISIAAGPIDDDDVERIAKLAIAESAGDLSQPFVIEADLLASSGPVPTVTIRHVEKVENVNRLASGQRIEFSTSGLSLVFGPNGSGKSGYIRILKQVCSVRGGVPPVLPNVYSAASTGPAHAEIGWAVNGTDGVEAWNADSSASPDLKHVNIFDSFVATTAVRDAAAAPFIPFPVRLLENLGNFIVRLRDFFDSRNDELQQSLPAIPGLQADSELTASVARLGVDLQVDDFLAEFCLTEEEEIELRSLAEDAESNKTVDIVAQSSAVERRTTELNLIITALDAIGPYLDPASVAATDAASRAMVKAIANTEASLLLLEGNQLDGVGAEQWKAMWEKARLYSDAVAYPEQHFPHVEGSAVCVLCEQPFSPEAAQRMKTLDGFVVGEAQAEQEALKTSQAQWFREATALIESPSLEVPLELANRANESSIDLLTSIELAIDSARSLVNLHAQLRSGADVDRNGLVEWDCNDASEAIAGLSRALEVQKGKLAKSQNQEKQSIDAKRLIDLTERRDVCLSVELLRSQQSIRTALAGVESARGTCSTNATTDLSSKLSEGLITESLRASLDAELTELGADRLTVAITKSTTRGASLFRLELSSVAGHPLVGEVLSEGELRVLGLASFLMEIRLTGGSSGVIFDDPVSSLDHIFRERVAKRLAKESTSRQVIVFTHDLVFLDELAEASRNLGNQPTISAIKETISGTGIRSIDLPAAGGNFETQLGHVERAIKDAKTIWESQDNEKWEPESRRIAGDMRTAWERGVEEVLLYKTVSRFRASIMTLRLREVHVEDDLWKEVESAMNELSGKGPHDAAMAQQRSPMTYGELVSAAARLRDWKMAVGASRKATLKRRDTILPKAAQ